MINALSRLTVAIDSMDKVRAAFRDRLHHVHGSMRPAA
jgi:hypothetical protein